jgi:hypothetical protein
MAIQVGTPFSQLAVYNLLILCSFMVAEVTPTAFSTIGWRYFLVFACTNFFLILPCKPLSPSMRVTRS